MANTNTTELIYTEKVDKDIYNEEKLSNIKKSQFNRSEHLEKHNYNSIQKECINIFMLYHSTICDLNDEKL
jgi:hypothetical protein